MALVRLYTRESTERCQALVNDGCGMLRTLARCYKRHADTDVEQNIGCYKRHHDTDTQFTVLIAVSGMLVCSMINDLLW